MELRTIRVKTCKGSDIYALVHTLEGKSFKLGAGLKHLQSCGWFLKHNVEKVLVDNLYTNTSIMKSTERVKGCFIYDQKDYTCKKCVSKT